MDGDIIPEDESVVALDSDARVGTNLGFKDPGGGTSALGKRRSTLLEKVQGIKCLGRKKVVKAVRKSGSGKMYLQVGQ